MASPTIPIHPIEVRSVLVATDLTESADQALLHAIAIARHYRSILYVVHVISALGFTLAGPDAIELAAEASQRDLDFLVNQLAVSGKLSGVEVRPVILKGNVDIQIESFVRDHKVDLIVAGTHGRQGMARVFCGSIAQLIAKHCSCPVLTVGPHSPGPWLDNPSDSEKPLLFATAFNHASAKAMPYAVSLANDFERQLFVMHVLPPRRTHLAMDDNPAHDDNEASVTAHLNEIVPSGACLGRRTNILVESCDPAAGILRAAKRIGAATIVMGAHQDSLSDLAIRFPWSIFNRVNREAACPVLTVRG